MMPVLGREAIVEEEEVVATTEEVEEEEVEMREDLV